VSFLLAFPNLLSLFRIALTPCIVVLIFSPGIYPLYAAGLFSIAAFTDFFDGYIARRFGLMSHSGAFLDPLADKILVLSAFFSFSMLKYIDLWMVLVIAVREVGITVMRLVMQRRGRLLVTSSLGKMKTGGQFFVLYLMFFMLIAPQYLAGSTSFYSFFFPFVQRLLFFARYAVVGSALYSGLRYVIDNRRLLVRD